MDEVLEKILSLPHLSLNKKEWEYFAYLLSGLEEKNSVALQKLLKEKSDQGKNFLSDYQASHLFHYLDSWNEMVIVLMAWMNRLALAWFELNQKRIEAEVLIPLIIAFLPGEEDQLKILIEKLDQASRIEERNEMAYSLVSVCLAMNAKLMETQAKTPVKKEENEEKINCVIEKMRQQEREKKEERQYQINQKKKACEAYRSYILKLLKEKLKKKKDVAYLYYFKKNAVPLEDNILDEILEDIEHHHSLLPQNKEVSMYLNQYLILSDLLYTLGREKAICGNVLTEFNVKLNYHWDILKLNVDDQGKAFLRNIGFALPHTWLERAHYYLGFTHTLLFQPVKEAGLAMMSYVPEKNKNNQLIPRQ